MAFDVNAKPLALGKLTTVHGTLVRITMNLANVTDGKKAAGNSASGDDLWFNKLEIKALSNNAGNVYIGYSNMVRATLVGVVRVIEPGESWSLADPALRNIYRAGDFYFDVDTDTDVAHGSVDVQ